MGVRGELFSTRLACEGRTYFFNVKENRMGDLFLSIVESKQNDAEGFDRRSIVLFQDNANEFTKAFAKALEAMDKASPSRKSKPATKSAKPDSDNTKKRGFRDDGRERKPKMGNDDRPRHFIEVKPVKVIESDDGMVPADTHDRATKKGRIKVVKVKRDKPENN